RLALLQAYRVSDAFALHTLEPREQHRPARAIDHDGDAGDLRFGGDQVQEAGHRLLAVEQRLVEVDVQDVGAGPYLLQGDGQRALVVAGQDELLELRRAGHV